MSAACVFCLSVHKATPRMSWVARFGVAMLVAVICVAMPNGIVAQSPDQTQSDFGSRNEILQSDEPLLIEADSVVYDYDMDRIGLVDAVKIHYGDYALRAQRVTLDRTTGRIMADGGVVLTEPGGSIVRASDLDITDTFGEGFVRQLEVETVERARFAAAVAERHGNETELTDGAYTACAICQEEGRNPTWRIKAKTIIHNQESRTVYYEHATFELWGVPIVYLPFLSHPDPTVRRKTGFLLPSTLYSDDLGFGVRIPFYWSIAPNMDITFAATPLTRQGVYGDGEFRHRLETGTYTILMAGIHQADQSAFSGTSGDIKNRGGVRTTGEFDINTMWKWGWDLSQISDRAFVEDYGWELKSEDEVVSTIYLSGRSERSELTAQAYAFRVLQEDSPDLINDPNPSAPFSAVGSNLQDKQPIVHPVIDHRYIWDNSPILGGELAYNANLTSLTREKTDAFGVRGSNFFRGVEGTFTRASIDVGWRRTITDPLGQQFTPFFETQGDLFVIESADKSVPNSNGDDVHARGMAAIGVKHGYPILFSGLYGTHVFEPLAQIIVRPNETLIGDVPNEDAQSVVFDDTNLFDTDKFSGFDRVEGGTRANLGLHLTSATSFGGQINALFGRSLHIAGRNSFNTPDVLASSLDSGLENKASDWVGRILVNTPYGVRVGARARFDEDTFAVNRSEVQGTAISGPLASTLTYAFIQQQLDLGINEDQHELLTTNNLKLTDEWRLFGSLRYDIEDQEVVRNSMGLGYSDESISWSVAYTEDRTRHDYDPVDRTLYFRLGLRTLGATSFSTDINN